MINASDLVFWILAALSLAGAVTVIFTRDVLRMAIGLAGFLISVAAWFLYFGQPFLAVAQVFVYVGGVLVLVLFAIMLVHRSEEGRAGLESRHALDSAMVSIAVFVLMVLALSEVADSLTLEATMVEPATVSVALLGRMLPHFEAAGVLLLAALVAVIVVVGGGDE